MTPWPADKIRKHALCVGADMTLLAFLRSEEVAQGVAARTRERLTAAGVEDASKVVVVKPSGRFTPTWSVVVGLPGAGKINERLLECGKDALRGAYSDADLVTTW